MSYEDELLKTIPMFKSTRDAFPDFEQLFMLACVAKDKSYILQREDDDPPEHSETSQEQATRELQAKTRIRDDALVKVWLLGKLTSDARDLVKDKPTAFQMMAALRKDFDSRSIATQIRALKDLLSIRFNPQKQSMENLCSSVNNAIQNLKKFGPLDFEVMHKVVLFMATGEVESYESLVTVLTNNDSTSVDTIVQAYLEKAAGMKKVIKKDDETRKDNNSMAFIAKNEQGTKVNKKQNGQVDYSQIRCHNCQKLGHMAKQCYAKKNKSFIQTPYENSNRPNYPRDQQQAKTNVNNSNANFSFIITDNELEKDKWYEDSCASKLFTNRPEVFHSSRPYEGQVMVGDREYLPVTRQGIVKFKSRCSDGTVKLIEFKNVKLCEKLVGNLFSYTYFDDCGIQSTCKKGRKLYYKNGEEVMQAIKRNKKWELQLEVILPSTSIAMSAQSTDMQLWHQRMSHLGIANLKRLPKMIDGIKFSDNQEIKECTYCIEGKMTRRPFIRSKNPRSKYPMDLIHMDFIIINQEGREGQKVVLVLTDDATLCKFTFPQRGRSGDEILENFLPWLSWAERMSDRKLKAIRHDNAKEFTSGRFKQTIRELGIEQQVAVPYEHKQAGGAEILNRILMD